MNRGRKEYYVAFALRAIGMAAAIAAIVFDFARWDVLNERFLISFSEILCLLYFGVLFGETAVRFIVSFFTGLFQKRGKNPYIIENIGRVVPFSLAVAEVCVLAAYMIYSRDFSVGHILGGTVLPLLQIADWACFAPHGLKKNWHCLSGLAYPTIAVLLAVGKKYVVDIAEVWLLFALPLFAAVSAVGLYFADKVLDEKRGQKRIPYPLLWDSMPVDISVSFGKREEAGSHGFVKTDGENFVFEDGTPIKFWGVNFNSSANFPEHGHSEKVARRLACAGVNMVRLHQLDAEWSTPNIFLFKKGKRLENTRTFDEESLERLDYLVYCLKKQGIYIYLDFLTYRRFRNGDGVVNASDLPEAAKPYCEFDRTLIELQKKYNRDLLLHKNPYTGLCYKDDPCIAMGEVLNECDLLDDTYTKITVEPYRTELERRYIEYAAKRGVTVTKADFSKRKDATMRAFLWQVQADYIEEIIADIRATGARFPMTAMNRESDKTAILTNELTDFSDSHAYWRGGDQRGFMNDPLSVQRENVLTKQLMSNVIEGKPFFASEWDAPWPNEYRADATLLTAAIGALQNWSGFTLHTYRYGTCEQDGITEKLGRTIALGGSYYRGLFDCYNDPAKMGLFYHAALLFRRGDVSPSQIKTVYSVTEEELFHCDKDRKSEGYVSGVEECQSFRYRIGEGEKPVITVKKLMSDTEELFRDAKRGKGYIDSPRTKAVYGFCHGKNELNGLTVEIENDFATVALSSLTDQEITLSDSLLLTTVGRVDNTDVKYNFWHTVLKEEGKAPILADVIRGKLTVKTQYNDLKVWAVNNEGGLIGQLKPNVKEGKMTFEFGKEFESVFYLIQRQ